MTKVSALTALGTPAGTEEIHCNDSGTDKKVTIDEIRLGAFRLKTQSKTIATGAITLDTISGDPPTLFYVTLDTESAAASDDLDTVNGGSVGDILVLQQTDDARDVTYKNNTGSTPNFQLSGAADYTPGNLRSKLVCIRRSSTKWDEITRSSN